MKIRGLDFMLSSVYISITSTFFVRFWWFFAQRVEMDAYECSWKDFSLTSTWSPKTRWRVPRGWWSSSWGNSVARSSCQGTSKKMQKNHFICWKSPILSMKYFLRRIFGGFCAGSLTIWLSNWVTPWRAPPPPGNPSPCLLASCWC